MDTILFNLLILGGLTDSQGRVWRCHPGQLYAVELTLPEKQVKFSMSTELVRLYRRVTYVSLSLSLSRSKVLLLVKPLL